MNSTEYHEMMNLRHRVKTQREEIKNLAALVEKLKRKLKEQEEKVRWHNLVENDLDLPEKYGRYLIKYAFEGSGHQFGVTVEAFTDDWHCPDNVTVLAWKDIGFEDTVIIDEVEE